MTVFFFTTAVIGGDGSSCPDVGGGLCRILRCFGLVSYVLDINLVWPGTRGCRIFYTDTASPDAAVTRYIFLSVCLGCEVTDVTVSLTFGIWTGVGDCEVCLPCSCSCRSLKSLSFIF